MQQQKNPSVKNPIVPILILFGLLALGVVGYQVFRIMLAQDLAGDTRTEDAKEEAKNKKTGNVFKDMALSHPKTRGAARSKKSVKFSYNALPHPHNVKLGNRHAKNRVTIFTDLACGQCRQQVNAVLKDIPLQEVQVVFKYAPLNEDSIKSGLFEQIAMRSDILRPFHTAVYGYAGDVPDIFMLRTLEQLGVSFKEQREFLKDEPGSITRDLDKDLAQGARAGIVQLPTFFLNRYRLGGKALPLENLPRYITALKKGEPLYAETE